MWPWSPPSHAVMSWTSTTYAGIESEILATPADTGHGVGRRGPVVVVVRLRAVVRPLASSPEHRRRGGARRGGRHRLALALAVDEHGPRRARADRRLVRHRPTSGRPRRLVARPGAPGGGPLRRRPRR